VRNRLEEQEAIPGMSWQENGKLTLTGNGDIAIAQAGAEGSHFAAA
jgi:hypothetical protein